MRWVDQLSDTQRRTLAVLATLVLVVGVAVAVITLTADDESPDDVASETTVASTTPPETTPPETETTSTTEPTTSTTEETTTTSSTTSTTSTTLPPEAALVMRPDGLGDLLFGADSDRVMEQLTELLGDPDDDTGWVDQMENYGICIGTEVRFVRWGSLQTFHTDGPSDWAPAGVRHFASYANGTPVGEPLLDLATPDGVRAGSNVSEVIDAYGDEAVVEDDPLFGSFFRVDTVGAGFLFGILSGPEPDDLVESVSAGVSCGE